MLNGMVYVIIWEMFHGRISLYCPYAAAIEFWEWVQVGIDVYIPHRTYHIKAHSSPWWSATCAAAIVHRNHFFCLFQQNKYSESKVKGFLKLPNLRMLIKSDPRILALGTYGELLIVLSTKANLLFLLYSSVLWFYLLHLMKRNYLLKN